MSRSYEALISAYYASFLGFLYAVNGEGGGVVRSCGFTFDSDSGALLGQWCPSREQQLSRPHDVAVSVDGANVSSTYTISCVCFFV